MDTIIMRDYNRDRKIMAIKAVRAMTGVVLGEKMSLKESKAVVDAIEDGTQVSFVVRDEHASAIHMILDAGEIVHRDPYRPTQTIESFKTPSYDDYVPAYGTYDDEIADAHNDHGQGDGIPF